MTFPEKSGERSRKTEKFHRKVKFLKNDDLYTKKNGEIANYKNIFIIDGTNFTNIPAGSSGLTIMANALRIAVENSND